MDYEERRRINNRAFTRPILLKVNYPPEYYDEGQSWDMQFMIKEYGYYALQLVESLFENLVYSYEEQQDFDMSEWIRHSVGYYVDFYLDEFYCEDGGELEDDDTVLLFTMIRDLPPHAIKWLDLVISDMITSFIYSVVNIKVLRDNLMKLIVGHVDKTAGGYEILLTYNGILHR